jgi:hypothetical protein
LTTLPSNDQFVFSKIKDAAGLWGVQPELLAFSPQKLCKAGAHLNRIRAGISAILINLPLNAQQPTRLVYDFF